MGHDVVTRGELALLPRLPLGNHTTPTSMMLNVMTKETNHAEQNAIAWLESITDQLARLKAACRDSDDEYETIREEILESPLSVEVRSDWQTIGEPLEPAQFCILLSTGGPALRIVGDLGLYNCPENSRLEFQDWGIPWQELPKAANATTGAILDAWAAQFYFGDA